MGGEDQERGGSRKALSKRPAFIALAPDGAEPSLDRHLRRVRKHRIRKRLVAHHGEPISFGHARRERPDERRVVPVLAEEIRFDDRQACHS